MALFRSHMRVWLSPALTHRKWLTSSQQLTDQEINLICNAVWNNKNGIMCGLLDKTSLSSLLKLREESMQAYREAPVRLKTREKVLTSVLRVWKTHFLKIVAVVESLQLNLQMKIKGSEIEGKNTIKVPKEIISKIRRTPRGHKLLQLTPRGPTIQVLAKEAKAALKHTLYAYFEVLESSAKRPAAGDLDIQDMSACLAALSLN